MNKTKKDIQDEAEIADLPVIPPETRYLAERYVVELPVSDSHFEDPWQLRVHVAKILENHLGDEVQLTAMRVKKPHLIAKKVSKWKGREPCARLYVTVKF